MLLIGLSAAVLSSPNLETLAQRRSAAPSSPRITIRSVLPPTASNAFIAEFGLTRDDYRRIAQTVPGIREAVPLREVTRRARHGEQAVEARVVGTTAGFARLFDLAVERGRFLAEADVRNLNNVAVIGRDVARQLFGGDDPVGRNLRAGGTYFLVVGVLEKGESDARRSTQRQKNDGADTNSDRTVYVPISTMRARFGDRELVTRAGSREGRLFELSRIEIVVKEPAQTAAAVETIRRLLERYHERADYAVDTSP